jgi:3-hydroxyisobutyrate dehydrogenase
MIALLGLGLMGSGMARTLLAAGYPLAVYNRSPAKAELLSEQGARVALTPSEAAEGAEIVISMVADDSASREVWLGENGALDSAQPDCLLIESSTLTTGWVRELAGAAAARGLELLDAPVTGSRDQAASGELLFLVGGSREGVERARPVLEAMGRGVIHMGPGGSGALIKLVNNFLCGVQAASLAEALGVIEASGLDVEQALGILTAGAPGSPLVRALAGRMAGRNYEPPHFALQLMVKDLTYSGAEGEIHGLPLQTGAAARNVFQRAVDRGYGERDIAAVVEPFREGRVGAGGERLEQGR